MTRFSNLFQTALLLGGILGLSTVVGFLVAGVWGVVWGAGLGLLLTGMGQGHPGLVLRLQGARPLFRTEAPRIHAVSQELARRAGLSAVPDLYVLPTPLPNAFAVGMNRTGWAVALSHGLLRSLDHRELTGVLAHEISHIRNQDTTILFVAGALGRMTALFATAGQILLFINLPLILLGQSPISWWLILLLLGAPTLSSLLWLGLSRAREFAADQRAAKLTGDPEGLARALAKMEKHQRGLLRRLLLPGGEGQGSPLLRTHPPSEERIRRLLRGQAGREAYAGRVVSRGPVGRTLSHQPHTPSLFDRWARTGGF